MKRNFRSIHQKLLLLTVLSTIFILAQFPTLAYALTQIESSSDNTIVNGVTYLSSNWRYTEDTSLYHRDFQIFQDNGVNLITLLTHWQNFEPSKGNYDYALLNRMANVAKIADQYGIKVIYNIHTTFKGNDVPAYVGNFINVFRDPNLYQAHLNAVKVFCQTLDASNVYGFQIYNEPVNANWGVPAGLEAWIKLFKDAVNACRQVTSKPISARIAAGSFATFDDRVFDIFDFMSINYYSQWHSESSLVSAIDKTHQRGKVVVMSEFGLDTINDEDQRATVRDYLNLFESHNVEYTTVWWWCPLKGPSSYGYNIFDYNKGQPRPAFYELSQKEGKSPSPPIFGFKDGFELGSLNLWSGVTATSGDAAKVVNTVQYKGQYAAMFQTQALRSGTKRAYIYKDIQENNIMYARGYFYIKEGLPLTDTDDRLTLIQFLSSNGDIICSLQVRRIQSQDRFALVGSAGSLVSTTAIYPQEGRWYCLELLTQIDETQGRFQAYIDGTEYLSVEHVNNTLSGGICTIRFGLVSSINVQHVSLVYVDSCVISTSYIAPARIADINGDEVVNIADISLIARAWSATSGSDRYDPHCDLNADGIINLSDVAIFCRDWNGTYE